MGGVTSDRAVEVDEFLGGDAVPVEEVGAEVGGPFPLEVFDANVGGGALSL